MQFRSQNASSLVITLIIKVIGVSLILVEFIQPKVSHLMSMNSHTCLLFLMFMIPLHHVLHTLYLTYTSLFPTEEPPQEYSLSPSLPSPTNVPTTSAPITSSPLNLPTMSPLIVHLLFESRSVQVSSSCQESGPVSTPSLVTLNPNLCSILSYQINPHLSNLPLFKQPCLVHHGSQPWMMHTMR